MTASLAPLILMIEDDEVIRLVAREALEQAGFRVEEAENGRIGLGVIEAHTPDLVLLDVMMPELDTLAATREIRRREQQSGGSSHCPICGDDGACIGDRSARQSGRRDGRLCCKADHDQCASRHARAMAAVAVCTCGMTIWRF